MVLFNFIFYHYICFHMIVKDLVLFRVVVIKFLRYNMTIKGSVIFCTVVKSTISFRTAVIKYVYYCMFVKGFCIRYFVYWHSCGRRQSCICFCIFVESLVIFYLIICHLDDFHMFVVESVGPARSLKADLVLLLFLELHLVLHVYKLLFLIPNSCRLLCCFKKLFFFIKKSRNLQFLATQVSSMNGTRHLFRGYGRPGRCAT